MLSPVLALALLPLARQLPPGWNDLGAETDRGFVDEPRWLEDGPAIQPVPQELPGGIAQIEAWIDALQETERPDLGYAGTVSGARFLPLSDLVDCSAMILLDGHGLRASEPLTRLVELGPYALPALLAHLEDPRPTRLTFGPEDRMGGLWLERNLPGNPLNEREVAAVGEWMFFRWSRVHGSFEASYTVTIGDLCFVALGQIVGRPWYRAARYQPSGHVVVCSPVRDPKLAAMLRAAWGGADPRALLLRSLLIDLRSRGTGSSEMRASAATRLAYWYPDESAAELVAALDALEGSTHVPSLVEALALATHPSIARAVARARVRPEGHASAARILRLEGELPEPALPWFLSRLAVLDGREPFPRTNLNQLLRAARSAGPDVAAPVFAAALQREDVRWRSCVCRLVGPLPEGDRRLLHALEPLLADERATGEHYAVNTATYNDFGDPPPDDTQAAAVDGWEEEGDIRAHGESIYVGAFANDRDEGWGDPDRPPVPLFQHERRPLRVCDEAARALTRLLPEADYHFTGDHEALDVQRDELRAALAKELARRR